MGKTREKDSTTLSDPGITLKKKQKKRRALLVTLYLQAAKSTTTGHHPIWNVGACAPALLKTPVMGNGAEFVRDGHMA
jgi:hypothetical protein